MNKRVQIPVYLDAWMRGDRYGEVVKVTQKRPANAVSLATGRRLSIATVKLDKSGGVIRVILDDCIEVA